MNAHAVVRWLLEAEDDFEFDPKAYAMDAPGGVAQAAVPLRLAGFKHTGMRTTNPWKIKEPGEIWTREDTLRGSVLRRNERVPVYSENDYALITFYVWPKRSVFTVELRNRQHDERTGGYTFWVPNTLIERLFKELEFAHTNIDFDTRDWWALARHRIESWINSTVRPASEEDAVSLVGEALEDEELGDPKAYAHAAMDLSSAFAALSFKRHDFGNYQGSGWYRYFPIKTKDATDLLMWVAPTNVPEGLTLRLQMLKRLDTPDWESGPPVGRSETNEWYGDEEHLIQKLQLTVAKLEQMIRLGEDDWYSKKKAAVFFADAVEVVFGDGI